MGLVLRDFSFVLIFVLLSFLLCLFVFAVPWVIAPRSKGIKAQDIYECGVDPLGSAWVRYFAPFYLYALIFVAFDVDVLYLLPIVLGYREGDGVQGFFVLSVFLAFLVFPIAYAWKKGVFRWRP